MAEAFASASSGVAPAGEHAAVPRAPLAYGLALIVGLLLTLSTYPPAFLLGTVDWLHAPEGDLAINVIAQRFFLADDWRWPLLQTLKLDAPHGVNMAFLDGIPLMALPLKLIAPLLPQGTHGIYLWYAVAWLLQPVAAVWCLRSAGERRLLPAVAVAVAAASMPAWWYRFDHAALCSHFLLLIALGLYLRLVRAPSWRSWLAAVAIQLAALLTHPYLAVMVLALFGAVPLTLLARHDRRWPAAALGAAATLVSFVAALSLLGYMGATGGDGFGTYSMNLLGPVWPAHSALFPWPVGLLDATGRGGWEGYNYLGAGLLLGLGAAFLLRSRATSTMLRNHLGLAVALVGLTVLALSQRPAVGPIVLFDLGAVPDWLQNMRSSGRFFWPVSYALLIAAVLLAARHPDRRIAATLVLAIGALQFADAAELRNGVRERVARYGAAWQVDEHALRVLLTQHDNLTLLPSWRCVPAADPALDQGLLRQLLVLASEADVPVSMSYISRWQGTLACDDEQVAAAPLGRGELRVLTPAAQAAYLHLVPDGRRLCSPLGRLVVCEDPGSAAPPPTAPPTLAAGETVFAGLGLGRRWLGEGWSDSEPEGVWSQAALTTLKVQRPPELSGPLMLELDLQGFAPTDGRQQGLELRADGRKLGRWSLPDRLPTRVSALLPAGPAGPLTFELRLEEPASPADRGLGEDARRLGVQLRSLTVSPVGGWPVLATGETRFGAGAEGSAMLASGWHRAEPGGAWSDGKAAAQLRLERPPELTGALELKLRLEALAPPGSDAQRVDLLLDGRRLARWELPDREARWVSAVLPAGPAGPTLLELRVGAPIRPVDRGLGDDGRVLGVNLQRLKVGPASRWRALVAKTGGLGLF